VSMVKERLLRPGETQGKCVACGARYIWQGKPRVRDARCPVHGSPLRRTMYFSHLPVIERTPRQA